MPLRSFLHVKGALGRPRKLVGVKSASQGVQAARLGFPEIPY